MVKCAFQFTYEFWRDSRFNTIKPYSIVIKPRIHTENKLRNFLFTEIQNSMDLLVHFKDIHDDKLADMIEMLSINTPTPTLLSEDS
jgi:hypothetical protein